MPFHALLFAISYVVTTLAGSGAGGVADGAANVATFMKPVGVASDRDGNVYVADAAAQRIRVIGRDGTVRTLAGSGLPQYNGMWVEGGYRDGPAATAQFNRPSGVAVNSRGVFVADTLNHCVRLIHDGIVSTYAGGPKNFTMADGPVGEASFIRPRAIGFDASGDLYVLDIATGLRRIHNDVVTTIPLTGVTEKNSFYSFAFFGPAKAQKLAVGTTNEILIYDRNFKLIKRISALHPAADPAYGILYDLHGNVRQEALDMVKSIGPSFGMAPLPDGSFVYADTRSHALRTIDPSAFPDPFPDAAYWDGGYRDGSIASALFNAPSGLGTMPDGSVIVADTANRRIRKVTAAHDAPPSDPPSARDLTPRVERDPGQIVAGEDPFPNIDANYYRIAYLGNSFAYYNTRWPQSIPGQIEASFRSQWQSLGFPRAPKLITVAPMRGLDGFQEYIHDVLAAGVVDAVVVQLNSANINDSFPATVDKATLEIDQAAWEKQWKAGTLTFLRSEQRELQKAGIPLIVVINPLAVQVSPNECSVLTEIAAYQDWMFLAQGPPGGNDFHDRIVEVLKESGVPYIDLLPSVLAAEDAPNRPSLYGTVDAHYSRYGRQVVANALIEEMMKLHFWTPAKGQ